MSRVIQFKINPLAIFIKSGVIYHHYVGCGSGSEKSRVEESDSEVYSSGSGQPTNE